MIMLRIFKGNMRTFMETIKLPDKGEAAQCKLHNFYLSISFIVSVKVCIFPLNMHDMIIYVARWWKKYTCSWRDKLIVLWILNRQAKIFSRKASFVKNRRARTCLVTDMLSGNWSWIAYCCLWVALLRLGSFCFLWNCEYSWKIKAFFPHLWKFMPWCVK